MKIKNLLNILSVSLVTSLPLAKIQAEELDV